MSSQVASSGSRSTSRRASSLTVDGDIASAWYDPRYTNSVASHSHSYGITDSCPTTPLNCPACPSGLHPLRSQLAGRVRSGWLGLFCFNRLCNQLDCPILLTWIDFNCLVITQEKRQRSAVCAAEENR